LEREGFAIGPGYDQGVIIKICGVKTPEIAEVAIGVGADWLGLVLVPKSPRHADDQAAKRVVETARGKVGLVGVLVSPTRAECEQAVERYGLAGLQIHGEVSLGTVAGLKIPVIRAINAGGPTRWIEDSWWRKGFVLIDAEPVEGELPGGTGRRVEEVRAANLARRVRLILAGGLTSENVAGAIEAVGPYGVDASSGLESSPGIKDAEKVGAFVAAARQASLVVWS
jgi:phosphoribosylanthranilate isomerase